MTGRLVTFHDCLFLAGLRPMPLQFPRPFPCLAATVRPPGTIALQVFFENAHCVTRLIAGDRRIKTKVVDVAVDL